MLSLTQIVPPPIPPVFLKFVEVDCHQAFFTRVFHQHDFSRRGFFMNVSQPRSKIAKFKVVFFCVFLSLAFATQTQTIAQTEESIYNDIGLNQLRALAAAPTEGVGVKAHLVEAFNGGSLPDSYAPDTTLSRFSGTSFDFPGFMGDNVADIFGPHATGSASNFFGTTGVARDLGASGSPSVSLYAATGSATPNDNTPTVDWINALVINGGQLPDLSVFDSMTVSSHSYAFFTDPNEQLPPLLARIDYIINESDTTVVVGTSGASTAGALPAGWAPSYNAIAVGLSNGTHGSGLTTTYNNGNSGRIAIDVVVQRTAPSDATPIVAGAVAILQDASNGSAASFSEVIRATIMAGATKGAGDIAGTWSRTPTQPLDLVYGAGELNILNSYNIQQGGEVNGGTTSATAATANINGWDYENNLSSNDDRYYEFTVGADEAVEDFSIALAWNFNVVLTFRPSQLADLSLQLTDSNNNVVDFSDSSVDNVEHIFIPSLPAGTYQLRVENSSAFNTDYGLAFGGTVVPAVLLGDSNLDGVVNFFDVAALVGFLTSGSYLEQADTNQDGVVNFLDIASFIAILTNT